VGTLPGLIGKVSEQFDNTFSPETPFDFVDIKCYPELDSDEEAATFRQALPEGQDNMVVVIKPAPYHRGIMKRLMDTLEVERRQHRLIMEESDSAAARKKGKNRKAAQPSTSAQTQVATDSLRDLDERLSALERDNIELKKDNARLSALERDNIELKRANVELKTTVDRHWTSISALSRRALLDDARLIVISKTQLPLNEIYAAFHQNVQRAADSLCQRLRTEANITISAHSMKMIFGFESAGRARGIASQTVREKGNAAAHEVDRGDVLHSVLQEDLTEPQRASLEEIYTIVCGHPPTFVV